MKLLSLNNVVVLSPHPDDIEYSLAGTILKHTDTLFHIFNMSMGGDFDLADKTRNLESVKAWQGVTNISAIYNRYSLIKDTPQDELVNWVENKIDFKYDAVLIPPICDFHFEHKIISQVGRALTRQNPISLIEYATPSMSNDWVPDMFVDITNYYKQKKEMLACFETQKHRKYFTDECIDSFHTAFFGFKRKQGFYEALKLEFLFL